MSLSRHHHSGEEIVILLCSFTAKRLFDNFHFERRNFEQKRNGSGLQAFVYSTAKGRTEKVGHAGAGSRREAEWKRSGSGMEAGRKRNGSGAVPTEAERKRNGSGTEAERKRNGSGTEADGSGTETGRKRNGSGTEAGRKRNGSGTDGNGDCYGLIPGRLFISWCYEKKHARLIVDIGPSCWPKKNGYYNTARTTASHAKSTPRKLEEKRSK